jgi:diguanylate cyclase (GGDEF)-like protein
LELKLEKLNYLEAALKEEFGREGVEVLIHYFFDSKWFELDGAEELDPGVLVELVGASLSNVTYHASKSLTARLFFEDLKIVVSLVFAKVPRSAKKNECRPKIEKIKESSFNAYRVSHNPLTFLLAKDSFKTKLLDSIKHFDGDQSEDAETQDLESPKSLAVLALDIDFFKQVNDTWGHLYGDQVLKIFGRRLDDAASKICKESRGDVSIFVGHPSGEEFLILIESFALREKVEEWANEFKNQISEEVLPSEKEWIWLSSNEDLSALSPPPIQDRTITTSIGVALYAPGVDGSTAAIDPVSSLLEAADTALYRAKAAGRNQVIFYDNILSNCGRVIELDLNTKVVAIDIGSNVGVGMGQEFKVFPPAFTGKSKFYVNDGRTTRTLGFYPRVESARVTVFNSQPELSFAFISSGNEATVNIEAGSHLEAIPAGSIGHLLPSSSKYYPSSDVLQKNNIESLREFIQHNAGGGGRPFAVVVRFSRDGAYLKKYGTAALNIALARLYSEARIKFNAAKTIEVLDRSSVGIAGGEDAYIENLVSDLVSQISSEFLELGVVAGVFCAADIEENLKPSNAIEFARFAASDHGRKAESRVRHFGYRTAKEVLLSLRQAGSFEVALTDFERLRSLGVENAEIFNLGGLINGALGFRQEALICYQTAIDMVPKQYIYKTNFASVAYQLGEVEVPLKMLNALPLRTVDIMLTGHPNGYSTYACLLAKAKIAESSLFDSERFALMAPLALEIPVTKASKARTSVIQQALSLSSLDGVS